MLAVVVFLKGSKVKNNRIGFVTQQMPRGPMLAVQPTVEMSKRNQNNSSVINEPARRHSAPTSFDGTGHKTC